MGLYIEGSVSPPLWTGWFFPWGPLYDDITYRVEASKPGYHLKRVGPHSFSCQKLGQISVHIYSKDDTDELIPSVLLSLSGDDGYRNNSISGAVRLKVLPMSARIALPAEDSEAFIYCVKHLCMLRGLVPETTYAIKVVKKDGLGTTRIERASPESVTIQVGSGDTRDLDFVVFEQPEVTILSCHVEGRRMKELQSQLLVVIKSASDAIKTESVFELPMSNFFQVKNLPKTKHLLQLRTSLQSRTHKFESEIIEVDLERTAQIHVGPLRYSFEEDHQKQELTPAPVFPLIVGVSVIALFITMPRLKDLYQATVGIPTPGFMTTAKREPRKPAVRKKAY
ncbi:hypothetical protein OIU77_024561 [Salix suchowensis]|uniref:DUF7152 domain-containing protein n=1 Tax=Salix suchowensis TaxID=1278906 RepID=A0ABQ9BT70_9ROSI|nr:hypothetical protein OIU77_024561 [Salix suchowensis]